MQFISVIVRILFGENMHLNYNPKDGLVNRLLISLALLAVFLISTIQALSLLVHTGYEGSGHC